MNELEQVERKLLGALRDGDLDAVGALLREDFLITTAGWITEPVTKEVWLESLKERMRLDSFDLHVFAIRQFGDVTIVLAESAQSGTHDGTPFSLTFRYTDVWINDDSGPALATRHASVVPTR